MLRCRRAFSVQIKCEFDLQSRSPKGKQERERRVATSKEVIQQRKCIQYTVRTFGYDRSYAGHVDYVSDDGQLCRTSTRVSGRLGFNGCISFSNKPPLNMLHDLQAVSAQPRQRIRTAILSCQTMQHIYHPQSRHTVNPAPHPTEMSPHSAQGSLPPIPVTACCHPSAAQPAGY
jgi:hypothetical protein